MVAVPGAFAVTRPVVPIDAVPGAPLAQVPPPPSLNKEVPPAQALRVPVMGPGPLTTFTVVVTFVTPHELATE